MNRSDIRDAKQMIRQGTTPDATKIEREHARNQIIRLLERSMRMGHDRLAIRRLAQAIKIGAPLSATHWNYCNRIAAQLDEATIHALLSDANV